MTSSATSPTPILAAAVAAHGRVRVASVRFGRRRGKGRHHLRLPGEALRRVRLRGQRVLLHDQSAVWLLHLPDIWSAHPELLQRWAAIALHSERSTSAGGPRRQPRTGPGALTDLGRRGRSKGTSTTSAPIAASPMSTVAGSASRRTIASAIGPRAGETAGAAEPCRPRFSPSRSAAPGSAGALSSQPAQVAVRPALVVEAGDRLLADVAALGEADRALDDPGLGGHRLGAHLGAEARGAGLDPEDLGGLLADLDGAGVERARGRRVARRRRRTIRSTPTVGRDRRGTSDAAHVELALGVLRARRLDAGDLDGAAARSARGSPARRSRPRPRPRGRCCRSAGGAGRRGRGLGSRSSQKPPSARPQDPHVGLHVALAVEQRRVAALARLERLDVVGQLPLQVLGGVGPADQRACRARSGRAARTPRAAARYWASSSTVAASGSSDRF